jgi:hypothetical protein
VAGDRQQPGKHRCARVAVTAARRKRLRERLGGQVKGGLSARGPAMQEGKHRSGVTLVREANRGGAGSGGSVRSPLGGPRKGSASTGCIRRAFSVTVKTRMRWLSAAGVSRP